MEYRKGTNGSIKSTRTWTFTDVKQQYGEFEGSGLKAQEMRFSLC